jgi:aspartyl-tRNA(Asn)/glutamyl-tRNA(Gln) amidotransferase subunit C
VNHIGTIDLATERLTLRRFESEDAENMYYNWAGDAEVSRFMTIKPVESADACAQVIDKWKKIYEQKDFYNWAIELNELEQPIGSIYAVDVDDDIDAVEISFCLGTKYQHQGYAAEAIEAVTRFLMDVVGAARVWAKHDIKNAYAGMTMAKSGLEKEGVLRHAGINNSGVCDLAIYAKVKSAAVIEAEGESADEEEIAGATVTKVVGEDGIERNVISDDTMEYVGILAKLELSPEEAKEAKKDMEEMLDYIDQLNELDTTGIEPMSHVFPVKNVFREDIVTNGDGSKDTLSIAPSMKDGGFKVPKTIGD